MATKGAARAATAPKPDAAGPPTPGGLGEAGGALWAAVVRDYAVADWQLPVLEAAAREADQAAEAEAAAQADGPFILDRYRSPKPHPGIAVARSSRLAVARLLRQLNLEPVEEHPGPGRYARGFRR